jgi:tight adherence protein C
VSGAALLAAVAGALAAAGLADAAELLAARRAAATNAAGAADARTRRWAQALARLGRRLGTPRPPGGLAARLTAAGLAPTARLGDVMAAKAGAALVGGLLIAPVAATLPLRLGVVALAAAGGGGFLAPDLWLARRARARAARAGLELADVLDLLRVAVQAGLPVDRALAEVGARRGGLVAGELRRLAARRELGVARAEGLAELRARLPLPAVAALAAALERADRHGAPPAPALAALAEQARADRARALHDRAAAAAPRIQLAVALLLVPAVLLLVAAGLVHGLT